MVRKATASVAVAGLLGTGAFTVLEANRQSGTSGSAATTSTQTSGSTEGSGGIVQQSTGDESNVVTSPSVGGDEESTGSFSQPLTNPSNAGNQGGMVVSGGS